MQEGFLLLSGGLDKNVTDLVEEMNTDCRVQATQSHTADRVYVSLSLSLSLSHKLAKTLKRVHSGPQLSQCNVWLRPVSVTSFVWLLAGIVKRRYPNLLLTRNN